MRLAHTPAEMQALADAARQAGQRIAFVPTMGALHDGHGSLLDEGRRRGELLVLSIFVNPMQFGPKEDLSRYPRTPEADQARAAQAGVDVLYAPSPSAMYPDGYQTTITVTEVQKGLDGDSRPGHFRGVATVVNKLFNAVKPHVALFGQKDYQQLALLQRMVRDLDLPIEVVGMPIVRDADGLAVSSRNVYLSADERARALALPRALHAIEDAYRKGERDVRALTTAGTALLSDVALEYLDVRDAASLQPVVRADAPVVALVAAKVGTTRLIDNRVLG